MPNHQYDDISDLPRPVSRRHRPMPIEERAVQFAPFAALACYEEILMEAARSTQECPQLSEDEQTRLDALLQQLRGRLGQLRRLGGLRPPALRAGPTPSAQIPTLHRNHYHNLYKLYCPH